MYNLKIERGKAVFQKLKHTITILLRNSTPRHVLQELKTRTETKIYTRMFTAALFIQAKKWKNPNVHQPMMEERDMVQPFEGMVLSPKKERQLPEIGYSLKTWCYGTEPTHGFQPKETFKTSRSTDTESKIATAKGWGGETRRHGTCFGGDGKFGIRHRDGCIIQWTDHQTVRVKMVNFVMRITCQLKKY